MVGKLHVCTSRSTIDMFSWPLPKKPEIGGQPVLLSEVDALEVMIRCIRQSAQGTLEALAHQGYGIVQLPPPAPEA